MYKKEWSARTFLIKLRENKPKIGTYYADYTVFQTKGEF